MCVHVYFVCTYTCMRTMISCVHIYEMITCVHIHRMMYASVHYNVLACLLKAFVFKPTVFAPALPDVDHMAV